jgi:hypothetical protein
MNKGKDQSEESNHSTFEEEITTIFNVFKPRPSQDFYRRMESAPWSTPRKTVNRFETCLRRLFGFGSPSPLPGLRVMLASLAILLLIVIVTLASPSLQAVAQQLLQFIIPAPTDELTLQMTVQHPGTQEPLNAVERYPLTLTQAEETAGYSIRVISKLPQGLTLAGARYNPDLQAVSLLYTGAGQTLLFTQRPIGEINEFTTVGASAPVEIVSVHGIPAEFVTGGWKVTGTNDRIQTTPAPGTQVSLGVYWDPSLPQYILRWQEGNKQYEILSTKTAQGITIDKDDLIAMAESIK